MPRVPTYDAATVEERALPGAVASSIVSPDMLNAGGEKTAGRAIEGAGDKKTIATGRAMEGAGDKINDIVLQAIERQDLRDVNTASATFGKAQQDYQMDVRKNRTGKLADNLTVDYDAWQEKQIKEISKTLRSPLQIEAFQTQAGRSGLSTRSSLGSFQVAQQEKAAGAAFEANTAGYIKNGTTAVGNDAAMVFKDLLVTSVTARVRELRLEVDGPEAKDLMDKALTEFHKQRIQQLASNPDTTAQASAYFTLYEKEIDGRQRAEIGGTAMRATAGALGSAAAVEVWAKLGPKTPHGPVHFSAMADAVRADPRLKGNDTATAKALAEIDSRGHSVQRESASVKAKLAGDVSTLITTEGLSRATLMSHPTYLQLQAVDGVAASAMNDYLQSRDDRRRARADATTSRAVNEEIRAEQILTRKSNAKAFEYSDPDWIAANSRSSIAALLPQIGPVHTANLLRLKDSFDKNVDNVRTAKLDRQIYNHLADDVGMNPNKTGMSDDEKDRHLRLRDAIDLRLEGEQKARGRPLNQEERRATAKAAFDDTIMTPTFFGMGSRVAPVGSLSSEQKGKAYVKATYLGKTETVVLAKIPTKFVDDATKQLKDADMPVTQQEIAVMWLKNRNNWFMKNPAAPPVNMIHSPESPQ